MLVDEADLWPEGQFVTTQLIVANRATSTIIPRTSRRLISGLLDAIDAANDDPAEAQTVTNDGIEADTTNRLPDETIAAAWENLTFTPDPIASSLEKSKDDAVEAGLLDDLDLGGIYDLSILNELLAGARRARGRRAVTDRTAPGTGVGDALAARLPSVPPRPLPAVALRGVSKVYGGGQAAVAAIDHIDLDVAPGELVCLVGVSGCGKSTLLNLIAGLDRPTTGRARRRGADRTHVPGRGPLPVADRRHRTSTWRSSSAGCPRPSVGPAWSRCCAPSTSRRSPASGRTSCPAACANGWRSPAPSHRTPTSC